MPRYETTRLRVILAVLSGAATGALMISAHYLFGTHRWIDIPHYLGHAAIMFAIAFASFMLGILVFGSLPWFILHRRGFRGWRAAISLGSILSFGSVLLVLTGGFGILDHQQGGDPPLNSEDVASGWAWALRGASLLGLIGAVVGLMIWRVAYIRCSDEPNHSSPFPPYERDHDTALAARHDRTRAQPFQDSI